MGAGLSLRSELAYGRNSFPKSHLVLIPMRSTSPRLDAELALYSLNAVSDMIIWLDEDGYYVFVNRAATEFLGYSAQELSALRVCDIDPDFDEARWREHWRELERLRSIRLETRNRTKSGAIIPIEVNASLVQFENRKFNCSIVRDISERKRSEAALLALNEQIYLLSVTDDLTQIANRRYFVEVLDKEFQHAQTRQLPLSLVLIDIDHFKAFNDMYGHAQGDDCLRRVAATISAAMKAVGGLAARYGGEEFACILPGLSEAQARQVCERLRHTIEAQTITHGGSTFGVVTASIGVCGLEPLEHGHYDALFQEADRHLYRAKANGRNRVEGRANV